MLSIFRAIYDITLVAGHLHGEKMQLQMCFEGKLASIHVS